MRNIQLPDRPLRPRELEKIREAVESGDLEVNTAFPRILEPHFVKTSTTTHGEVVIRAASYFAADYTTVISIGVSFVPVTSESASKIQSMLTEVLESAGLTPLVGLLQLNDVRVDIT